MVHFFVFSLSSKEKFSHDFDTIRLLVEYISQANTEWVLTQTEAVVSLDAKFSSGSLLLNAAASFHKIFLCGSYLCICEQRTENEDDCGGSLCSTRLRGNVASFMPFVLPKSICFTRKFVSVFWGVCGFLPELFNTYSHKIDFMSYSQYSD